ncbi:DUF4440 domain-containing protein [Nocardia acidivorans]|uniref:DUF4440 domain-containing protein n=1 Tax=Nocardia acidivorans TaxID=404580 RepID=UPI000B1BF5A5|nr:DUF4440 domain-containing protein [Nocardia acidivorans]
MHNRPTLGDPARATTAHEVAARFAEGLQQSGAAGDADGYDGAFAADVVWGSPYGASVVGYAELNAIHRRLMDAQVAPPSQFEVVVATSPTPKVVLTQIRRRATEPGGFSENAMYVLVERNGRWWLAGAQNTPITQPPGRTDSTPPTPPTPQAAASESAASAAVQEGLS